MKMKNLKCLKRNFPYRGLLFASLFLLSVCKAWSQFASPVQHDFWVNVGLLDARDINQFKVKTVKCNAYSVNTDNGGLINEDFLFEVQYDNLSRLQACKLIWQDYYESYHYSYSNDTDYVKGVYKLKRNERDTVYDTEAEYWEYYFKGSKYKAKSVYYSNDREYPIVLVDSFWRAENSEWISSIQIWDVGNTQDKLDTVSIMYRYDSLGNLLEYVKKPLGNIPSILRVTRGSATQLREDITVEYDFCVFDNRTVDKRLNRLPSFYRFSTFSPDRKTKVEQTAHETRIYKYLENSLRLPQTIKVVSKSKITIYTFEYVFY